MGLERVLAETERPPRNTRFSGVVAPDAASVILSAPTIWEIVMTLRAPAPVSAEGMARLRALLCDGAGPLYCGGDPEPAAPDPGAHLPLATGRDVNPGQSMNVRRRA